MENGKRTLSDVDSASIKALNGIIQVSKLSSLSEMQFNNFFKLTDLDELRKMELERDQKIRKLEQYSSESSTWQDEEDVRITKLIKQVHEYRLAISNLKPSKHSKHPEEIRILFENDNLEIEIRQMNWGIENIENKFDNLKKAHKHIVESLSQVHLKNEYQDIIDTMREDLRNNNNDYNEARSLLKELQKIAWAMLPPKLAKSCEEIETKMENIKFKWEEIQFIIYKRQMDLSKMHKEIVALSSAFKGEYRIKELYEKKIEALITCRKNLADKLEALNSQIAKLNNKFSWQNKMLDKNQSKKQNKTGVTTGVSRDSEKTTVKSVNKVTKDEKLEFYEEKIEELDKEIAAAKNDLADQQESHDNLKDAQSDTTDLKTEIKRSLQVKKLMATRLQQEIILRKTYYNQIEDLKGKIRVFCRCRPISQEEINRGNKQCCSFPDIYTVIIKLPKGEKEFQFDRVFPSNTLQDDIFNDTSKLLQSAFDGFNVCIFAYGQTGSGKTFTLIGNIESNPGIVPRAFKRIFEIAHEGNVKYKTRLHCYMLELYNEKLLDLMTKDAIYSDKLEIKKDTHGMVIVPGAAIQTATTSDQLKELFLKGNSNRHIASTKMNSESSRSHLIISIMLTCHMKTSDNVIRGKISIIDLAGSERMSKSGVQGVGAQEAMSINMSLSALGDVISALTTGQPFVPYRNNKLTLLMQDSIGGNAKTLMFVNISPVDYNAIETASSLTYGARVKLIKNESIKVADAEEAPKLLKIIESLQRGEKIDFN